MSFKSAGKKYNGDMLDNVLHEYERASKIVNSITELPEFWEIVNSGRERQEISKEIDRLEDRWLSRERNKLYKAIDDQTGIVYLIRNPAVREFKAPNTIVSNSPRKVGHISEISGISGIKNNDSGWGL